MLAICLQRRKGYRWSARVYGDRDPTYLDGR